MKSFPQLSPYTFGSMSLGEEPFNLKSDIAVARRAMEAGVWFHSSPTYQRGLTYMILRMAFDEARSQRPRLILKIRDAETQLIRFEVEDALRRLGLEQIDIIQLVHDFGRTTDIVEGFLAHDERWELVESFKQQGKIGSAVLFLEKDRTVRSRAALEAGLFDGVIFYNNLVEKHLPAGVGEFLQQHPLPVLALRTVYGGLTTKGGKATETDAAQVKKLERLGVLAKESDCEDLVELSMRYALAHAKVRTTIGGTKNLQHLDHFLRLSQNIRPLPAHVVQEIEQIRG